LKTGYEVVYGVKTRRKEGALRRFMFSTFYKILGAIATNKMPMDAGTFCIMDRRVVDILTNLSEKNKYFSGLRAWTGFTQTGVIYRRGARTAGDAASWNRLFRLAFDGVFSFSYIPLRLASLLGFMFALTAFLLIVVVIIGRLFFSLGIVGWASTMSAILLIGGVQLITLGIIGEYLGRIYDQVKNRPEYIISEKVGI
jgi:polyisoprenyl-phosphate glycosyltransferase